MAPGPETKLSLGRSPGPVGIRLRLPGFYPSFLCFLADLKVICAHHCAWDPWRGVVCHRLQSSLDVGPWLVVQVQPSLAIKRPDPTTLHQRAILPLLWREG
ncbi:unnamed protein product [Lota lota]